MGQLIATSHDRFPPKCTVLEGKWDPLFQEFQVGEILSYDLARLYIIEMVIRPSKKGNPCIEWVCKPYDWVW